MAGFEALDEVEHHRGFRFTVRRARFRGPDGVEFERDIVRHPGAVGVLPLHADGTVTLVVNEKPFEVTTLREDVETDGRHATVRFGRDWRKDAERRDFTINGLSLTRHLEVIDFVGGESDPATNGGKAVTALASRMQAMGFSNLVSTIYAQTRHESLNELNRDLIMEDFAAWARHAVAR